MKPPFSDQSEPCFSVLFDKIFCDDFVNDKEFTEIYNVIKIPYFLISKYLLTARISPEKVFQNTLFRHLLHYCIATVKLLGSERKICNIIILLHRWLGE